MGEWGSGGVGEWGWGSGGVGEWGSGGVGEWGSGGTTDEPKADQNIVMLGAKSYAKITWKGFFTQSQVLLSSVHYCSSSVNS